MIDFEKDGLEYLLVAFIAVTTCFSVFQLIRGITRGKVIAPISWFPTKRRTSQPLGFWTSMVYYAIWVSGAAWVAFNYFQSEISL
jgi:hypothetical protein